MKQETKLIILDFDGVIEDTYELHYQLSKRQIRGLTREEHKKLFEGNIYEQRKKLASRNTGYDLPSEFDRQRGLQVIDPKIKKALLGLYKKYELGINSSAREGGLRDYLQNNEIGDLFSFVYGKETDSKKVAKFQKIFGEQRYNINECVFITDSLGDILEGNAVGIKSVGVLGGYHEITRLRRGLPWKIIQDITKLEEILENDA